VLGFDAPLTIETEDVLDCPKAIGSRLIMDIIRPTANIVLTETMLNL